MSLAILTDIIAAPGESQARSALLTLRNRLGLIGMTLVHRKRTTEDSHEDVSFGVTWRLMDLPTEEVIEIESGVAGLQSEREPLLTNSPEFHFLEAGLPYKASMISDHEPMFFARHDSLFTDIADTEIGDWLILPIYDRTSEVFYQSFSAFSERPLPAEETSLLIRAFTTYQAKVQMLEAPVSLAPAVALGPRELECIRWAVAGKTLEDIASITGLSYRTVRYHIDRARQRYGYSTNQQTFVRAALDYGLDPLG